MLWCEETGTPYPIFPWSENPQISKSNPLSLAFHLSTALIHVVLATAMLTSLSKKMQKIFEISQFIFTFFILVNITHFGNFSPLTAVLANGFPLVISWYGFLTKQYTLCFSGIVMPIVLETLMYSARFVFFFNNIVYSYCTYNYIL